jgi:hypothetical protein
MKRSSMLARAGVLGAAFAFAAPVWAHEGHTHKAMGTVAVVDASRIDVKSSDGKVDSIAITPATKFKKGSKAATSADVMANEKVVVKYTESKGEKTASEIEVGSSSSSKSKSSTHKAHSNAPPPAPAAPHAQ